MASTISFGNENTGFQAGIIHGPVNAAFYPPSDSALNHLPYARDAAFNSFTKQDDPICLPGTRVDLLKEIYNWADGQEERCMFWLNGLAGTGKSTISRTIARRYLDKKRLGASFFFSRGGGDVGNASMFVTTIAFQLASSIPSFDRHLCNALAKTRGIVNQSLRDQWQQLILDPLLELSGNGCQSTYVIVVDALDECDNESNIQTIIHLLGKARLSAAVRLRVFLTSRREVPIRYEFHQVPDAEYKDFVLHNISSETVDHDITVFFQHSIEHIRKRNFLDISWPSEEIMGRLIQLASGLFIWAATTCRFIYEGKRFAPKRLDMILQGSDSAPTAPEKHLDNIYTTVLRQSIDPEFTDEEKEEAYHLLRVTLGSIVILYSQLSKLSLSRLLDTEVKSIEQTLSDLHSVLDIPDDQSRPISLHHPSFRDYLLNKDRCKDADLWVKEKQVHRELAGNCIRLMMSSLKQDVCGVGSPGTMITDIESGQVERCLSPEIQYACLYWVQHIRKTEIVLSDNGLVHCFLEEHVLHWFEALAWMRKVSEGLHALTVLKSFVPESIGSRFLGLLHDTKRFILKTRQIIERAPLQTYLNLAFAPTRSILRTKFSNCIRRWILKLPNAQDEWSALQQILEGHSDSVSAIAFSPDGKLLASSSRDGSVKLWDTGSGALQQTLKGYSTGVKNLAFSPDGKLLASGSASDDGTVKLWDTGSGALQHTLGDHSDGVSAIAFSPDGKLLASGFVSSDCTVKLWNIRSGALQQTLEGHLDEVSAIAFSPDGKLLASVSTSDDGTVKLWDTRSGALQQTLEGHSDWVSNIAFSPDGKLLASGSKDCAIKLWDPSSGALRQRIDDHHPAYPCAVAFSPDGKLLASGSCDYTIKLWDAISGALQQTLEGHSDWVIDLIFSLDGKLLMSASYGEVKLWDIGSSALYQTIEGNFHEIVAIAFSPDSKLLASVSTPRFDERSVKLWDTRPSTLQKRQLEGHSDSVCAMTFSPDGKLLASASGDCTVKLWNTRSGALLQTLEGHSDRVSAIAFSPDGKLLASASGDCTVKLWNTRSSTLQKRLEDHSDSVRAITFSPDGKLLASVSNDFTVKLWNTGSGALQHTLNGYCVGFVAFSLDGKLLASASSDRNVKLWDTRSGALQHTFGVHSTGVSAINLSPDGKLLASASGVYTVIKLWDTRSGMLKQRLVGCWGSTTAIAFSPDSKLLASASSDRNVKLWDTGSGALQQTLEVDTIVSKLSFSNDGTSLDTDRGSFSISSVSNGTYQPYLLSSVFVQDRWVVVPSLRRILWLPPDYQPEKVVTCRNLVGLGYSSGRVLIMEFAL